MFLFTVTEGKASSAHGLLLLRLAHLLLLLLLEVFLLGLGVQAGELGVTLGLLGLLALKKALLILLLFSGLLELLGHKLTGGADLLGDFRAEVGGLRELVGDAKEVGEESDVGAVVTSRGESVLEQESLARVGLVEGGRLFGRLIGDDEVLKTVAGGFDGGDELRGEQGLGDLGILAHDGEPLRQLVVVLGGGEGQVITLVADVLHDRLVDNSPHEGIVAALVVLGAELFGAGKAGYSLALFAVKGVEEGLHGVAGNVEAGLPKEAGNGLDGVDHGVELLGEGELHVGEGDVLTAGGVGSKLEERLLLEEVIGPGVLLHVGHAAETYEGKLVVQSGRMGADPSLGLLAVGAGAKKVEDDNDEANDENGALTLEFGEGVALVDIVPPRPWDSG